MEKLQDTFKLLLQKHKDCFAGNDCDLINEIIEAVKERDAFIIGECKEDHTNSDCITIDHLVEVKLQRIQTKRAEESR